MMEAVPTSYLFQNIHSFMFRLFFIVSPDDKRALIEKKFVESTDFISITPDFICGEFENGQPRVLKFLRPSDFICGEFENVFV
jgi:hypothetical protein